VSAEQSASNWRDALLNMACEDRPPDETSAELGARLAQDPDLRAELVQTRALLNDLRAALRPAPLTATALTRIQQRLDQLAGACTPSGWRWLRIVGLAAAATVLLTVLAPWRLPRGAPTAFELSGDDAAAIVMACRQLAWSGKLDYDLQRVADELDEIRQQINQDSGGDCRVRWGAGNDWDAPPDSPGPGAMQNRAGHRLTCAPPFAGRPSGTRTPGTLRDQAS